MSEGWIKLHRKLLGNDMFRALKPCQRDVMIICLLLANHQNKKWEWKGEIFECLPGQFITSLESLQKLCAHGTTISKIRTAIAKLEKWGFLTNESTKTGRLITINNWGTYQNCSQEIDKGFDRELTKQGQRSDKQTATTKNEKNVKNEKNQKKAPEVEIPHNLTNPKFLKIWEEFKDHRRQMKKPMTALAESKMLKELQKHGNNRAIQMLEQSIMNGWQGIFELKSGGYNGTKKERHERENSRQIGRPEDFGGTTGKIEL